VRAPCPLTFWQIALGSYDFWLNVMAPSKLIKKVISAFILQQVPILQNFFFFGIQNGINKLERWPLQRLINLVSSLQGRSRTEWRAMLPCSTGRHQALLASILKIFSREKHSSLFALIASDKRRSFTTLTPDGALFSSHGRCCPQYISQLKTCRGQRKQRPNSSHL
jgi:hypothetical protein